MEPNGFWVEVGYDLPCFGLSPATPVKRLLLMLLLFEIQSGSKHGEDCHYGRADTYCIALGGSPGWGGVFPYLLLPLPSLKSLPWSSNWVDQISSVMFLASETKKNINSQIAERKTKVGFSVIEAKQILHLSRIYHFKQIFEVESWESWGLF